MVKEVKSWEACDEQLFRTEAEALRHDLELVLLPVFNGNIGLVYDLINKFDQVFPAMKAYRRATPITEDVEMLTVDELYASSPY